MEADGFDKLKEYLDLKPENLRDYLIKIVPDDLQDYFGIKQFGWVRYLFNDNDDNRGLCNIVVDKYYDDVNELEKAKNELVQDDKNYGKVSSIMKSIKTIKDQRTIEFLSRNNLIPKYGFPVDTVELQGAAVMNASTLRLNRDLFSAISEYAPESEIVADGKLFRSRYVRKLSGYEWPKYNYAVCPDCLTLNRTGFVNDIKECKTCGQTLHGRGRQYIIPKFGFLLDNEGAKPVGLNKPERTYKGSISYIGEENMIEFHEYTLCGHRLIVGNSKMDSLAVLNESPFYICDACGYGYIDEKTTDRIIEKEHYNSNGYKCSNSRLVKFALGHEFQTDVALIKFIDFDISKTHEAWTILYSLLEGLSRYMCIDRNELSGCLQWYKDDSHLGGNFGFVLFDNTPGGAGYVRQLKDPIIFANMMKEAFRVVSNCSCGGETADTACYSCLCNYYNQKQHDILKRIYAINFYSQFEESPEVEWEVSRNEEVYYQVIASKEDENKDENKEEISEKYHVSLCYEGQNQVSEKASDIWDNLIDDCDLEEKDIIEHIKNRQIDNISKPIYRESLIINETQEKIFVDLIWEEKKVMLFLKDSYEDFIKAQKIGWACFCTCDNFDVDDFLSKIEV